MGDRDLLSDSDSSDEDFIPEGVDKEPVSEDESGNESNEQEANEEDGKERKRKKLSSRKRSRKKMKSHEEKKDCEEEKNEDKPELSAADRKQKADALWADFLKDCDPPVKRRQEQKQSNAETDEKVQEQQAKTKVVEEYDFAGEKVLIEKDVTPTNGTVNSSSAPKFAAPSSLRGRGGARGGIASILGHLGRKNKLSTLEKSKLDWNTFKKDEGIEEDIERHNRGKNGYLERQDFLERADLKQFEIEKSLRASKRSSLR